MVIATVRMKMNGPAGTSDLLEDSEGVGEGRAVHFKQHTDTHTQTLQKNTYE